MGDYLWVGVRVGLAAASLFSNFITPHPRCSGTVRRIVWPSRQTATGTAASAPGWGTVHTDCGVISFTLRRTISMHCAFWPSAVTDTLLQGMFRAEGKRKNDLDYAALYSLTALLSLLKDPDFHDDDPDPNLCMVSTSCSQWSPWRNCKSTRSACKSRSDSNTTWQLLS